MEFDYALLADHAEVINGKLYLMGGGWDVRQAPQAPARAQFAVLRTFAGDSHNIHVGEIILCHATGRSHRRNAQRIFECFVLMNF